MATGISINVGQLTAEYQRLWDSAIILDSKRPLVETIRRAIRKNQGSYEHVASKIGCPWELVSCIHNMESSLRFDRHLHNGDPLTARTVHVPKGRPKSGTPPFTWEESAVDSLVNTSWWDQWDDWTVPGSLYMLERYNGWGHRRYHPSVLTPYLWSWTNHYTQGKYAADGKWDPNLISQQCGCVPILLFLSFEAR